VTRPALGCAVILACCASSASATTTPGLLYVKRLVITNEKILISGHTRPRMTDRVQRYKRGVLIRYEVRNRGTRTFSLNILGSSTGTLRPGRRTPILVAWNRRGSYAFRALPNGPRMRVVVY
jgi:hypothetical protein